MVADENFFSTTLKNSPFCGTHENTNFVNVQFDQWEHDKATHKVRGHKHRFHLFLVHVTWENTKGEDITKAFPELQCSGVWLFPLYLFCGLISRAPGRPPVQEQVPDAEPEPLRQKPDDDHGGVPARAGPRRHALGPQVRPQVSENTRSPTHKATTTRQKFCKLQCFLVRGKSMCYK